MAYETKRLARMVKYCADNPNELFTSGYDESISNEEANMILSGNFDGFEESMGERVMDWESQGYLWEYWEGEFATEFGYDSWADMPERIQALAEENRVLETTDWTADMIRHWRGNVTATLYKASGDLIYAPSARDTNTEDTKLARYIVNAFGATVRCHSFKKLADNLWHDLEVVYGGYDGEAATLCGRVDLTAIYKAGKAPAKVTVGPEDVDNLLWYDHWNGCGNMGNLSIGKTRTFRAKLMVDGSHGYGVDACYGFTGEWWRHELRVAT